MHLDVTPLSWKWLARTANFYISHTSAGYQFPVSLDNSPIVIIKFKLNAKQVMLAIPGMFSIFVVIIVTFIVTVFILSQYRTIGKKQSVAILALSIGMFTALALQHYQFIVDDVYISLRYARNLAEGHGLVFNVDGSAPVEGYTNFLWVVLEATFFNFLHHF